MDRRVLPEPLAALRERVIDHLEIIYPDEDAPRLANHSRKRRFFSGFAALPCKRNMSDPNVVDVKLVSCNSGSHFVAAML